MEPLKNIREIREEQSLKQKDMAGILGINRSTYASYEIERDTIPIYHLNKLCNYFDISIDYAVGLNEKKNYLNSKPDIDKELLKIRLKEMRKDNQLTQVDIAKILNISRSTWTGYEYGKFQIPTLILLEIASRYNCSMDYLLGKINKDSLK